MKKILFLIYFIFLFPSICFSENIDKMLDDIIECESGGSHYNLWGDINYKYKSYGICQFQERTFNWLKKLAKKENLEWKKREDQVHLLRWSIENNYCYLWTCGRKLYPNICKK